MADENVLKMPTLLDRLAEEIRYCLKREVTNRQDWIDIKETLCLKLAEGRKACGEDDTKFGAWCETSDFGRTVINHQDRSAAIKMAQEPAALRKCLEATERSSLQLIHKHDFAVFTSAGKDTFTNASKGRRSRQKADKTKVEEVAEYIRPKVEAGETISRAKVADEMDVGERVVEIARERELGRLQGLAERPPMTRQEMSQTMAQRYEAALRKARLEIRDELKQEVFDELNIFMVHRKERIEWAEKIIGSHQGVMPRDTFNLIRACLHPDHNTFSRAAEAFDTFIKLEKVLVKPDPKPLPAGAVPLPSTVEELMAMRRTRR